MTATSFPPQSASAADSLVDALSGFIQEKTQADFSAIRSNQSLCAALDFFWHAQIRLLDVASPSTKRLQFCAPGKPSFFASVAPDRVRRPKSSANGCCPLCDYSLLSQGRQVGVLHGRFRFLINPFPFSERHFTIVREENGHVPQGISAACVNEVALTLGARLADLMELASELPDYLILHNAGAGASLPHHLHYQALPRWRRVYPLEFAARHDAGFFNVPSAYPVAFFVFRALSPVAVLAALREHWLDLLDEPGHAAASVIATNGNLYVVPRDTRVHASFPVACLEALGEWVFQDETSAREASHQRLWAWLASAQDQALRDLVQ